MSRPATKLPVLVEEAYHDWVERFVGAEAVIDPITWLMMFHAFDAGAASVVNAIADRKWHPDA